MTALRSSWAKLVLAAALPVAVSAVWIPLRDNLPNTDLALVLVLVVGLVGWLAGTGAAAPVAAAAAAISFDLLDARPYGTLTMSRGTDVTTALILLATGSLVGLGAAHLGRLRRSEDHRSDALAVVMEASGLVATGEEQRLITEALGAEICRVLELDACEFRFEPPTGTRPSVARDGGLVGLVPTGDEHASEIDLPVWSQGDVVAHYRLTLGSRSPSREELRVALSLADQAGAAMANYEPPSPPRPARLRLLPTRGDAHPAGSAVPEAEPEAPLGPNDRHRARRAFLG